MRLRFAGPITGYRNGDDGKDAKTGGNAQQAALVDWFMNDVDNPSGQSIRNEYGEKGEADVPDARTQGQLEVPFLLPLSLSSLTLAASARACSNCRGHFERAHTLRPAGHLPAQPLALRGGRLATASRAIFMNAPLYKLFAILHTRETGGVG
jgi:hypothetical protein